MPLAYRCICSRWKSVILCSKGNAIALVKCLFYEDYEQCNIAIALFVADGKIALCTRCNAVALWLHYYLVGC
jgi:hypothetical protein